MKSIIKGKYIKKFNRDASGFDFEVHSITEKVICYLSQLNGKDSFGLQIEVGENKEINLYAVADKKSALNVDDINWMFDGFAYLQKNEETKHSNRGDSEWIYALGFSKGDIDRSESYINPAYLDKLFLEMAISGIKLRVFVRADTEPAGQIFIISPKEFSLRQKTLISLAFRDLDLIRFEDCDTRELDLCISYMSYLLDKLLIEYDRDKFAEEDDDEDFGAEFMDILIDDSDPSVCFPDEDSDVQNIGSPILIENMDFSVRTYNCLKRAQINDSEQLRKMSKEDLQKVRNLGEKGIDEIREKLHSLFDDVIPDTASQSYMEQLDKLIGLDEVKEQVRRITAFARMKKAMGEAESKQLSMALNMEFTGNPGTAKTTVARILAGLFNEIGLLSSSDIVEVGRSDLVAGYVGQTAKKVKDVFAKAKGRLLFIDEAYTLLECRKNDFGDEAIDTIVQEMENHREETIVIFAGYPDKMAEFFERNPGLRSRVPFSINFRDYESETLAKISAMEASKRGFDISDEAYDKVISLCTEASKKAGFGNGRFCRNLVENAILNYAYRNYQDDSNESNVSPLVLETSDFQMPQGFDRANIEKKFGFVG